MSPNPNTNPNLNRNPDKTSNPVPNRNPTICGTAKALNTRRRRFYFGVSCNADTALASAQLARPNTEYDLAFLYDGTTAQIFVNGLLDISATKA